MVVRPATPLIVSLMIRGGGRAIVYLMKAAASPREVEAIVSHSGGQCTRTHDCHRWSSCSPSHLRHTEKSQASPKIHLLDVKDHHMI